MMLGLEFSSQNNAKYPLGKGEVVSSILPGSTRKPLNSRAFRKVNSGVDTFRYGTMREHDVSISGKSVDFVRRSFSIKNPAGRGLTGF